MRFNARYAGPDSKIDRMMHPGYKPIPPCCLPALVIASTVSASAAGSGDGPEHGRTAADVAHGVLSKSVNAAAGWFDSFFDDPRVQQEAAYSRVKLSAGILFEEGESAGFKGRVNAKINLPRTKRRLKLVISSDEEGGTFEDREVRDAGFAANRETTAGLQYSIKSTPRTDFSWRLGLKLGDDSELLSGPRYRITTELASWLARFTEGLFWGTDRGWSSKTRLDFDHLIGKRLFFRWKTEAVWRESDDGLRYDVDFLLSHRFGGRQAVVYEFTNRFATSPRRRLDQSGLRLRFRQRVWRRWLFFEAVPQLVFRNDDDFRATPGILLQLEMIIGGPLDSPARQGRQIQSLGLRNVS